MKASNWFNGMIGMALADAYGAQTQGWDVPPYSWTDDTSMAIATIDSITEKNGIDVNDIMKKFSQWLNEGKYSSIGKSFDIGRICMAAIERYDMGIPVEKCGLTDVEANGNGSLMRIMPVVLYCLSQHMDDKSAVDAVEKVSAITHAHRRSTMACGIYYFIVKAVVDGRDIQEGIDEAFEFYDGEKELAYYHRIKNYKELCNLPSRKIIPSGYVVETLEAALWALGNSNSYTKCVELINTFNGDIDTIGAIAGGVAGIMYSIDKDYEHTSRIGVMRNVLKLTYAAEHKFSKENDKNV